MQQQRKNPNRLEKVGSFIQQELGPILHEQLQDQNGLVTITKVEVSRDMKWAKVWISILGGDDQKILGAIKDRIYYIQGGLNEKFSTKIIPRLQFFLDTSPRYAEHIEEMIKKIHEGEE